MKYMILASALFAALAAAPAEAADSTDKPAVAQEGSEACLQNNRLWSWNVVNSRTLSIVDRANRKFTVRLAGGCVGLNNLIPDIEVRGVGNLSCVRRGDFVRFVEPTLGRMSCTITAVEPMSGGPQPVKDQDN